MLKQFPVVVRRIIIAYTLLLFVVGQSALANKKAIMLDINSPIGPSTQDYIKRNIDKAAEEHAALVILRIDTPGGLDKAMREIIKDILSSPLPIISYVTPQGARAASAGTYILYASHVAAMAPATNLGAATPVQMGGGLPLPSTPEKEAGKENQAKDPLEKKIIEDAVAYIQGLAQLRKRNSEWAEKAVREGESLESEEALKLNVIDMIAKDIPDLLKQINGITVMVQGQPQQLQTEDIEVEAWDPDWRASFLTIITDPSVAYLLLLIGFYGLFFEFSNPGYVLPGVVGLIAILLALYALQLLPISYAGLALMISGIAFMFAEIYVSSYGILAIGGIIAFVVGSVLLIDVEGYSVPHDLIFGMSTATAVFFLIIVRLALKARKQQVVSGMDALIGSTAIVQEDFDGFGRVRVAGETWNAKSLVPLQRGQKVIIVKSKDLELFVTPENNKGDKK